MRTHGIDPRRWQVWAMERDDVLRDTDITQDISEISIPDTAKHTGREGAPLRMNQTGAIKCK
jgi:hypothetical protein